MKRNKFQVTGKKLLASLLAAAISCGGFTFPAAAATSLPFSDVSESAWFYKYVVYAYEHKILSGTSATTFEPGTKLTRAMVVTSLYSAEGRPSISTSAGFTDLKDNWYKDSVNWAASEGIVAGVGNGKFAPSDLVTREQLALILYKYTLYKGYDVSGRADLSSFADVSSVDSWAKTGVEWAVDAGVIAGKGSGHLDPLGKAERSEFATMMTGVGAITNDFASNSVDFDTSKVPSDASYFNGHYYKIYNDDNDQSTWTNAETLCEENGGHLVTITSDDEWKFVNKLNKKSSDLWIGARLDDDQVDFHWVTGESFTDTDRVEYDNYFSNEFYLYLSDDKYKDNNNSSGFKHGYICEWDGKNTLDSIPMSTTVAENAVTHNGHQYKLYTFAYKKYTWEQAEALCEKHGGHLITINSTDEKKFADLLNEKGKNVWIGARLDDNHIDFRWITGEPFDDTLKITKNNYFDNEFYLYMNADSVMDARNESNYSSINGFICEWDDQTTLETIPMLTTVPDDADAYNGHHYKVYYPSYGESYSWTQAEAICEQHGGHLATISNKAELNHIALLDDTGKPLWIGGTRENDNSAFTWITGETFDASLWDGGNNSFGNETKLFINNGTISDTRNESNYSSISGFICEWDQ